MPSLHCITDKDIQQSIAELYQQIYANPLPSDNDFTYHAIIEDQILAYFISYKEPILVATKPNIIRVNMVFSHYIATSLNHTSVWETYLKDIISTYPYTYLSVIDNEQNLDTVCTDLGFKLIHQVNRYKHYKHYLYTR